MGIQKIVISVSCMLIFSGVGLSLDAWPSSSQVLAAQIYYVDRNHPGANDGNAGTEDSPWRTIQHAIDVMHDTDFYEIGGAHVDCFQTLDNNGEHVRNILIEGNTCSEFHQGFMGEAEFYHNSSHVTFRNNVFAHGGAWGLCVVDIPYVTVENNTFYDILYHGAGFNGDSHHNVVINNIFYNMETSYWAAKGGTVSGDHNLIFQSRDPGQPGPNDLINVNPLLVNPANNDFHLQESSPAIDAGQSLPQVINDIEGKLRPQGAGYRPGETIRGSFADVPSGEWYAPWTEACYDEGILLPCQTEPQLLACPEHALDRALAARMMYMAKELASP